MLAAASAVTGFACGVANERDRAARVLPDGFPRSCGADGGVLALPTGDSQGTHGVVCEPSQSLTTKQRQLCTRLQSIVGQEYVEQRKVLVGARIGKGEALAVCSPGTLQEAIEALRVCAAANVAIIPQGRNTGLTGGSVPRNDRCSRPTVVLNLLRLNQIYAIGNQMLCLAGAGIFDLSKEASKLGRESHSILGSVFLNPTVAAGVSFGSGGTQIRKGPAYTERALYARVNAEGQVEVVNTLGFDHIESEEELFARIEAGNLTERDVSPQKKHIPASCADSYCEHVCKIDGQVARYNADTSGIDPCRSEGKVLVLATLHDTFPAPTKKRTLWIACESLAQAQSLKREVLLNNSMDLPISCEYMDRDCFDVVNRAGRVLCHAIARLGIGGRLKTMWDLKLKVESAPLPFFDTMPDRLLYLVNDLLPSPLPDTVQALGEAHDHHLLVTLGEFGNGELERTERRLATFHAKHPSVIVHECTEEEDVRKLTYFRFAAAPAFRTWCIGNRAQGLSVDYALAKHTTEKPPLASLAERPLTRMRYSHFGCNVVHEDLAFAPGVDVHACKMSIKREIEASGGMLPAEHGHGTEYSAPADTQSRWKSIDPTNVMNPGVGGTPCGVNYSDDAKK
jgi:D-lactate dehydrogenase (quinone)